MAKLSLTRANRMINRAFAYANQHGAKPLAIVVLDAGGNLKAFQSQDGAANNRFEMARGKAKGALAVGTGTRWLHAQAETRPHFLTGLASVIDGGVLPVPGGVIALDKQGNTVAAIGVSGDTSDIDEAAAVAGIDAANFSADTGA